MLLFLSIADEIDAVAATDGQPIRRSRRGIIIVGEGTNLRAFEPFSYNNANVTAFAAVVNRYAKAFGDSVKTYCMAIPTAAAFYYPDSTSTVVANQHEAINVIYDNLEDSVKGVDVYASLAAHAADTIYLRTDHHWSPKGAYYAAEAFARVADVPFMVLSCYDTLTVNDFVGSMAAFTRDKAVKKAAEPFVYYIPRDVEYTKKSIRYRINSRRKPYAEQSEVEASFFKTYADGSAAAYCTFMGGDARTVKVTTSTHNGRRLLILKDSYGNALPGYLFHSFEEIHVIDFRYFLRKIKPYVVDNGITDVLFAHNLIHACTPSTVTAYNGLLGK